MKLSLIQMHVEPGDPQRNLENACQNIAKAAEVGADVILLPEALDYGWMDESARDKPEGLSAAPLQEAANQRRVYVCAGLIERRGDDLYNAAALIDPDGEILLTHRKINELEIAHSIYRCGSEVQPPIDTPFGRIGLHICADAFADERWISRKIATQGADIILSPCAWAVPPNFNPDTTTYGEIWRENYIPVAKEHGCWIAGCSNVGPISSGPWAGHRCIGKSIVVNATGEELLTGPFDEEAVFTVDFS
jgi:predicted amidohydrolase